MKRIDELLLPALAEFGLSEEYNRRRAEHRVERQEDEATDEDCVDGRPFHNLSQDGEDARVDEREERQLGGGEGAGHLDLRVEQAANTEHDAGQANGEPDRFVSSNTAGHADKAADGEEPGDGAAHGSGSSLGYARSLAKYRPVHAGAQLFAANASKPLNVRSEFDGRPVLSPLVGRLP